MAEDKGRLHYKASTFCSLCYAHLRCAPDGWGSEVWGQKFRGRDVVVDAREYNVLGSSFHVFRRLWGLLR